MNRVSGVKLTLTAWKADSTPRSKPAMRTTSSWVSARFPTTKYLCIRLAELNIRVYILTNTCS
jgi:hypothetical protein